MRTGLERAHGFDFLRNQVITTSTHVSMHPKRLTREWRIFKVKPLAIREAVV